MLNEKKIIENLEECREFADSHEKFLLVKFVSDVGDDHERFKLRDLNLFLRANRYKGPLIFSEDIDRQYLLIDIIHLEMRCLWSNVEEFRERSLLKRIWDFQSFVMLHTKLKGPFINQVTITESDGSRRTVILEAEGYYDKAFTFSFIAPKDPVIVHNYDEACAQKKSHASVVAIYYFKLTNAFKYVCFELGDPSSIEKFLGSSYGKAIPVCLNDRYSYWLLADKGRNFLLFTNTKDESKPFSDITDEEEHLKAAVYISKL